MSRILLDTSILIDFLRSREKGKTLFYRLSSKNHTLLISIVTHTELYAGRSVWEKPDARKTLEILFENLTIVPLTVSISTQAGRLRALNNLPLFDAIIAATALQEKVQLATKNTKDFEGVPNLRLYKENLSES